MADDDYEKDTDERYIHRAPLGQIHGWGTTLAEEDALAEYFRSGDVRPEWEDYREMFAYFDGGMADTAPTSTATRARLSRLWCPVAAAAVAGWIAGWWLMGGVWQVVAMIWPCL